MSEKSLGSREETDFFFVLRPALFPASVRPVLDYSY